MIECVTLSNNHNFEGNPLYRQHQLRYESIIKRQDWNVPTIGDIEYDSYDNPAAYYLVKRNKNGKAIGSSRLYPTDRPYMLEESFAHLVNKIDMPKTNSVWEGSRFCIDKNLKPEERKSIIQKLIIGYLEFGLEKNIKSMVGVMYPVYWKNIFIKSGWDVEWIGKMHRSDEGHKIIAGQVDISQKALDRVRDITGIHHKVLSYGTSQEKRIAA